MTTEGQSGVRLGQGHAAPENQGRPGGAASLSQQPQPRKQSLRNCVLNSIWEIFPQAHSSHLKLGEPVPAPAHRTPTKGERIVPSFIPYLGMNSKMRICSFILQQPNSLKLFGEKPSRNAGKLSSPSPCDQHLSQQQGKCILLLQAGMRTPRNGPRAQVLLQQISLSYLRFKMLQQTEQLYQLLTRAEREIKEQLPLAGAEPQSSTHSPSRRIPQAEEESLRGSAASPSSCHEMDGNVLCPSRRMNPLGLLLTRRSSVQLCPPSTAAPPGGTRARSPAGRSPPSHCHGSHSWGQGEREQL